MISSLIVTMVGVFVAAVLRGFTGFGFGLAAVPLLSLVLPPAEVVPLVITLQVVIGGAGLRAAVAECKDTSRGLKDLECNGEFSSLMMTTISAK